MGASPVSSGFRKAIAIAAVSVRRVFKDRTAVFFMLLFPLLLVLVLGSAFGSGTRQVIGVAVPADDPLAAAIVAGLNEDDDLQIREYGTEGSLRRAVERGTVRAGAVIPGGYGDELLRGETVEVAFVTRPGTGGELLRPVVARAVGEQGARLQAARFAARRTTADVAGALALATELAESPAEAGISPVSTRMVEVGEELFPASLGQFDVGASQMLLLFVFVNGLAGSTVLIQNRRLGTSRRMLSTPTSIRSVMAGEALAGFGVTLFQGVYIMAATSLLFGVSWGSLPAAMAVVVVFASVAAGAAMLAGAVFSNDQQAASVGVLVGLGLAALGGSMAPLEVFSPTMRDLAHITPHAWGNDAFATLIRRDGGLGDIAGELTVLAAMAAVLLGAATWRLHRTLTSARS